MTKKKYRKPRMSGPLDEGALDNVVGGKPGYAGVAVERCSTGLDAKGSCNNG